MKPAKQKSKRWTPARRKAHGEKIQAGRLIKKQLRAAAARAKADPSPIRRMHFGMPQTLHDTDSGRSLTQPNGNASAREAIRAKVRAILPDIITEEVERLLKA